MPPDSEQNFDVVACGGLRRITEEQRTPQKHSYHVTWQHHVFGSMEELKVFIKRVFRDVAASDCPDFKVYSEGRAMRMPWNTKNKKSNTTLIPIDMTVNPDSFMWTDISTPEFDPLICIEMDPTVRPWDETDVFVHTGASEQKSSHFVARADDMEPDELDTLEEHHNDCYLQFFSPLLHVIIATIQNFRRATLTKIQRTTVSGAGVPIGRDVHFSALKPTFKAGVFVCKVTGDSFCEHDAPSYFHSTGDKVSLSIDLKSGTYNQLCYACNPRGNDIKYYTLFGVNKFHCQPLDQMTKLETLELSGTPAVTLFLQCIRQNVKYSPKLGCLYVYEPEKQVWVNNQLATQLLCKAKVQFEADYAAYLTVALHATTLTLLDAADTPKKENRVKADYRAFCNKGVFKDVTGKNFRQQLTDIYLSVIPATDDELNRYPHLVPLNDGSCFNVYTGESCPRKKTMHCTNIVDAHHKSSEDDECKLVRVWFHEVAKKRASLARYMMRLCGYMMTHLTHDRHYYVNIGKGRNGKSVMLRFLKSVLGGLYPRHAVLHENFFLASANNKNSSEACTPARMEMEHKSCYLVEELPPKRVATSLIKQISSNEDTTGRQLYQEARTIEMRGKLMINTNNCPNIPGDESAVWDRMILIPFDIRYAMGDEKADGDCILPSDPIKVENLIALKDAFLTVCLNEVFAFYRQSYTPFIGTPSVTEFPIPDMIKELVYKRKTEAFPLISFIAKYLKTSASGSALQSVYYAFLRYCKIRCSRVFENVDQFKDMLAKLSVNVRYNVASKETFIVGSCLTEDGEQMCKEQALAQNITTTGLELKDIQPSQVSIPSGFQAQKRKRDYSEDAKEWEEWNDY